ncbi:MAG: cupin [Meiothermus sp.]
MTLSYPRLFDLRQATFDPGEKPASRILCSEEGTRVVLLSFGAGQELAEHSAPRPAILQIVDGEGWFELGDEQIGAHPGTWLRLPAYTRHAVRAKTPMTLLLTLLPKP